LRRGGGCYCPSSMYCTGIRLEGLLQTTKREPARLTSLRSRFEPEVFRMRKSIDALSKDVRQYPVLTQRLKWSNAHITTAQASLNTETLLSIGDVRTSIVFMKWRPYLHSAILPTVSHTDISRTKIRIRIDEEFRHSFILSTLPHTDISRNKLKIRIHEEFRHWVACISTVNIASRLPS